MLRMLHFNRLSWRLLAARPRQQLVRTIAATQDAHNRKPLLSASEIKKIVPALWVRKMKTFFASYDLDGDGILSHKDYFMLEQLVSSIGRAAKVSEERIKHFETRLRSVWLGYIAAEQEFQWTENQFLEKMFEAVSRPGAEAQFRISANQIFDMIDTNQDGKISKEEDHVARGGVPWHIVIFSSMDANRDGQISRDEFVKVYMDFHLDFADETNPCKYF